MASDSSLTVSHALDILDLLNEVGTPMGVLELSRRLAVSPSSVHRLLTSLKVRGLIQQDPASRAYWLGWKLVEYSDTVLRNTEMRPVVGPVIRRLRDVTGEAAIAHMRVGDDRVCIDEANTTQDVRRAVRLGWRIPLHAGATGHAILAFSPAEDVDRVLSGTLGKLTSNTLTDRDQLLKLLAETRRTGIAYSCEETASGVAGIAAPFFRAGGAVVGAIAVSGPAYRCTHEKLRAFESSLLAACQEVSRSLGFQEAS